MTKHFVWEYEDSAYWEGNSPPYYHIYPVTDAGDVLTNAFALDISQSPMRDYTVELIVNHLNALAESLVDEGNP